MARRVVTPLAKFVAPVKGDYSDKRCAFVQKYDEVQHRKITYRQWCSTCGFYICAACDKEQPRGTAHELVQHQPDTDMGVDVN